jgi:hypothetical protein
MHSFSMRIVSIQTVRAAMDDECRERAYVMGFMPSSEAERFVANFTKHSDKMAVILRPCCDYGKGFDLPVRILHGQVANAVPLYNTPGKIDALRKYARLEQDADVVLMACIDLVWNRAAEGPDGLLRDMRRLR